MMMMMMMMVMVVIGLGDVALVWQEVVREAVQALVTGIVRRTRAPQ